MVISQEDYTSNLDPCGFYNYGEAEEYGIVINSNSSGIVQNNFDILHIEYPTTEKNTDFMVNILNANAQIVISENMHVNKQSIDISNLPKGIYFLRIQSQENVLVKKIEISND